MLQVKNICKKYVTGELTQVALDNVSVNFRDNEFVAILGPSGSGKTTLLNVVGGLDRYDSGDLVINGISTKKYKDKDWDAYRNHTIGFVFQSYNLIPHQSVLANVELALTISGVSGKERKQRAKDALEKVGLKKHIHKRPNQLSGGQMQRVAIARALVNDPDILLADEPTGALDSETSIQVMNLLNEVAKDRLVIMVTHNPELAEEYATRIVKLKDGKITGDTNPFDAKDAKEAEHKKMARTKMTRRTALGLSFNNLRTKKGRTILTSFAGSIGIIGIALILSLSNGVNTYINDIQRDTMTSYPISISETAFDLTSMIKENSDDAERDAVKHKSDAVYGNPTEFNHLSSVSSSISQNNLTAFKKYIDNKKSEINKYIGDNGVVYSYDTRFDVFSYDKDGNLVNADGSTINEEGSMGNALTGRSGMSVSFGGMDEDAPGENYFGMMLPGKDGKLYSKVIEDNYKVVSGNLPQSAEDVVVVINDNNEIALSVLYRLGILPSSEYKELTKKLDAGEKLELKSQKIEYDEIVGREFYIVPFCDYYQKNDKGTYDNIRKDVDQIKKVLDKAIKVKVSGVIKEKDSDDNQVLSKPIAYTQALTNKIIEYTDNSEVVKEQRASENINILNGMTFEPDDNKIKIEDAKKYINNLGITEKSDLLTRYMTSLGVDLSQYQNMGGDAKDAKKDKTSANAAQTPEATDMKLPEGADASKLPDGVDASQVPQGMDKMDVTDEKDMAKAMDKYIKQAEDEFFLWVYDNNISSGSYDKNLKKLGVISLDAPSQIDIYVDSFEDKDGVSKAIEHYNKKASEDDKIVYTDFIGLLLSSITTIINVISYVLIAFVAVSLVVSSIMIGIITYISVLERTKEIGILRAIGASKKNISQVFNAETFIIGLGSGLIGIGITLLLLIPINKIIHAVADNTRVNAILPISGAIILIILSVILTLLGGFIPAKKAAKKDPVTALRTE